MTKPFYVKAITNDYDWLGIKRGDVCKVIAQEIGIYTFDRKYSAYEKFSGPGYFVPTDCPCNIKRCIKHRPK